MYTAIVLICALGAPCDLDHNLGRLPGGVEFRTAMACAMASMQGLPQEHPEFRPGTYPKMVCTRWQPGNQG